MSEIDADLVTVELTRDEAEHAMARGDHPTNACLINDYSCEICAGIAAKLRVALEEPGPYAKAFRERVCPVPEFPGIQNQQEGQA